MEYGWTLKAIEVMPDHVHLFLEASPDADVYICRNCGQIFAIYKVK